MDASTRPWEGPTDELYAHYSTGPRSDGSEDERVDYAAARDWAENGQPGDGQRYSPRSEYFWQNGQLWNDGAYAASDGSAQPYVAWAPQEPAAVEGRAR
jgi:hypothetical protein